MEKEKARKKKTEGMDMSANENQDPDENQDQLPGPASDPARFDCLDLLQPETIMKIFSKNFSEGNERSELPKMKNKERSK